MVEVSPGIHRIKLSPGGSSLREVNCYLIQTDGGYLLVDCGWDTPDTLEQFLRQLHDIGAHLDEIHTIVVTHGHSDHYGLAATLRDHARFRLLMHRVDWQQVSSEMSDPEAMLRTAVAWMDANGLATAEWREADRRALVTLHQFKLTSPDQQLEEGDGIPAGASTLRVLWTPGHSQGHICLYDPQRRILLAGDHVLERITPHVSMFRPTEGDPLGGYIPALRKVRDLKVDLVLPGHGNPFVGLARRVDELIEHHLAREAAVVEILSRGRVTAIQVARQLTWTRQRQTFDRLSPFYQRLVLGQTLAHLRKLEMEGRVATDQSNGLIYHELKVPATAQSQH